MEKLNETFANSTRKHIGQKAGKFQKWLPWVAGYNLNGDNNGYAGNKKVIDAIQIVYDGKLKAHITI